MRSGKPTMIWAKQLVSASTRFGETIFCSKAALRFSLGSCSFDSIWGTITSAEGEKNGKQTWRKSNNKHILTLCVPYLKQLHGQSWPGPHRCCEADTLQSLQLPCAWAWSAGTSWSCAEKKPFGVCSWRTWEENLKWFPYLLVLLSSRSHRSSATRNTDFKLIGSEMAWTRPSSTSSTSSWFLHVWTPGGH